MVSAKRGNYASPKQAARQQKILATARKLIAQKGYNGLTMRDLARASGVSDKTIYNLYGSKDQLMMLAVSELMQGISQRVEAQSETPGLQALLLYGDAMMQQIIATPAYAEAMARGLFQANSDSPLIEVLLNSNDKFLRKELFAALERQEIKSDTDVPAFARILVGHTWGILLLWDKGLLSLEQLPEMFSQSQVTALSAIAQKQGSKIIAARLKN